MKKYIIFILISGLLFSCSSDDEQAAKADSLSKLNLNVVETQLTSATIKWNQVVATDGSNVTYDIYINDQIDLNYTLVEADYSSNSYLFDNLSSGVDYFVKLIAKSTSELESEKTISFTTVPNLIPTAFDVTVENVDETSATITWDEATDPEETQITYDIYLNDVLVAENLTDLTYTFSDLEDNTDYKANIIAKDADGFTREVSVDFTTVEAVVILGTYSQDDNGTVTALGNLHSGTIFYYGASGSRIEFDVYFYDEETGARFYFYVSTTNTAYNFEEQEFVLAASDHKIIEASYTDDSGTYPEWYFGDVRLTLKRNDDGTYSASFIFDTFYDASPFTELSDLIGTFDGELVFDDQS
ncbi:MAG: fibronectin type III domain-containing protein [Aestuariibaculum sp.]